MYRDGSRDKEVLVSTNATPKPLTTLSTNPVPVMHVPRTRPSVLNGTTRRINTGNGGLYVTINSDANGTPYELLGLVGKTGKDPIAYTEAITRLISLLFRMGANEKEIIHQLRGIGGESIAWDSGKAVKSIPDAIAIVLEEYVKSKTNFTAEQNQGIINENTSLSLPVDEFCTHPNKTFSEGCEKCSDCGWSKC